MRKPSTRNLVFNVVVRERTAEKMGVGVVGARAGKERGGKRTLPNYYSNYAKAYAGEMIRSLDLVNKKLEMFGVTLDNKQLFAFVGQFVERYKKRLREQLYKRRRTTRASTETSRGPLDYVPGAYIKSIKGHPVYTKKDGNAISFRIRIGTTKADVERGEGVKGFRSVEYQYIIDRAYSSNSFKAGGTGAEQRVFMPYKKQFVMIGVTDEKEAAKIARKDEKQKGAGVWRTLKPGSTVLIKNKPVDTVSAWRATIASMKDAGDIANMSAPEIKFLKNDARGIVRGKKK